MGFLRLCTSSCIFLQLFLSVYTLLMTSATNPRHDKTALISFGILELIMSVIYIIAFDRGFLKLMRAFLVFKMAVIVTSTGLAIAYVPRIYKECNGFTKSSGVPVWARTERLTLVHCDVFKLTVAYVSTAALIDFFIFVSSAIMMVVGQGDEHEYMEYIATREQSQIHRAIFIQKDKAAAVHRKEERSKQMKSGEPFEHMRTIEASYDSAAPAEKKTVAPIALSIEGSRDPLVKKRVRREMQSVSMEVSREEPAVVRRRRLLASLGSTEPMSREQRTEGTTEEVSRGARKAEPSTEHTIELSARKDQPTEPLSRDFMPAVSVESREQPLKDESIKSRNSRRSSRSDRMSSEKGPSSEKTSTTFSKCPATISTEKPSSETATNASRKSNRLKK